MNTTIFLSGILLGLAGSAHCLGMCGPLSWALPIQHVDRSIQIRWLTLYQFGRILSYGILGLLAGTIGTVIDVAGFQQFFSIALGAAILFFGMAVLSPKWTHTFPPMRRLQEQVQQSVQRIWKKPMNGGRMFLLGSLNGWLPCGMVYVALVSAMTMKTTWGGGFFLISFGMGTIPAMMLASLGGWWIGKEIRLQMRRVVPVVVGVVGLILILRGLGLDLPYLSPSFNQNEKGEAVHCVTTPNQ